MDARVAIERCAVYKVRLVIRINIHIFGARIGSLFNVHDIISIINLNLYSRVLVLEEKLLFTISYDNTCQIDTRGKFFLELLWKCDFCEIPARILFIRRLDRRKFV